MGGGRGKERGGTEQEEEEVDLCREREKVEAWLKARRVLAMADDFQLLLSPSREWKMENPARGYARVCVYVCMHMFAHAHECVYVRT